MLQNFYFLADRLNICNFIFFYDCLIDYKVWLRSDQNCRRSNDLKFPAPYGPVLTKISKCHKIFNFWQIAKSFITFYSPMTSLCIIKFGSDQMKTEGVAFCFAPIGSHVNEKEKKNIKILKLFFFF